MAGSESPDGRYFCYVSDGLWVVPMKDGLPFFSEKRRAAPSANHLKFDISRNGVYFSPILGHPSNPRSQAILFYNFATGRTTPVFTPEKQLGFGLSISRDERSLLFSQTDDSRGDLVLVESSR